MIVSLTNSTERTAVADWIRSDGFEPVPRATAEAAAAETLLPFAVLIADVSQRRLLAQHRGRNPHTPTILIGDAANASQGDALGPQATYLSRPLQRTLFMCFVAMAVIDRPVRRSIRKVVTPFEAAADGIPSHIVDVSFDGLRLEMPRDRRSALPPYFTVRVPLVGVAVSVQRMWTHVSHRRDASIWYGGALCRNRASVYQAWRTFVDAVPTTMLDARQAITIGSPDSAR